MFADQLAPYIPRNAGLDFLDKHFDAAWEMVTEPPKNDLRIHPSDKSLEDYHKKIAATSCPRRPRPGRDGPRSGRLNQPGRAGSLGGSESRYGPFAPLAGLAAHP